MQQTESRARVVWSDPMWTLVEELRAEAATLRRIRPEHPDADSLEAVANRVLEALAAGEGEVWVTTAAAQELTRRKPDTIRSWHRRQRIRTRKTGGTILYHRDDLLAGAAR